MPTKKRRVYKVARPCQDCGRSRPVTRIFFWVNGMPYLVCGECVRMYRRVICTHYTDNTKTDPTRLQW